MVCALRPARTNFASAHRRSVPVIAKEEAEPLAAVEDDEDEDAHDAADVPEIEADIDADVDPVIVRD